EKDVVPDVKQKVGQPYDGLDETEYRVAHIRDDKKHAQRYPESVKAGRYLIDEQNRLVYMADVPINRQNKKKDAIYTKEGFDKVIVDEPAVAKPPLRRPFEDYKAHGLVELDKDSAKKYSGVEPGRYLVDEENRLTYKEVVDAAPEPFKAPQPQLFAL